MSILDFFKKKKVASKMQLEDYYIIVDMSNLEPHIEKICELLQIEMPEIHFVPYMCDYEGNHYLLDGKHSKVPDECYCLGYSNDDGSIHVAFYDPLTGQKELEAVWLLTIAHELRHQYQKKYEHNKYYAINSVGALNCINDISEIDADAFAMAYMKSINQYDEASYMTSMNGYMLLDRGKRKNRTRELKNKYFSR